MPRLSIAPALAMLTSISLVHAQAVSNPYAYRGFTPGMDYRAFADRAGIISDNDVLRCNTALTTAKRMECGVSIRDPADNARFYLSAYVLEGKIMMLSFGDSGDARLVTRTQQDLARRFGAASRKRPSSWEWKDGQRIARLTWRGRGSARWIYVSLTDQEVLNGIVKYVPASKSQH
ncbi:MAG TPA: hypothetical protein VLT79_00510 [Gemmatimonadales bacterium]|nr:hypothetical protein [Gemmatimonadales bacterium]